MSRAWVAVLLAGCGGAELDGAGLIGNGPADPFPSVHALDGAGHVALDGLDLPMATDGTPVPGWRVAWRTGFSPGQSTVIHLSGADPATLPSWHAPTPGAGGARLYDLTDGVALPCMAELDAHPDATDPTLIIRPLLAMQVGHRIAAVVTTDVAPRPARFDALVTGRGVPSDLAPFQAHYADLLAELDALGVPDADIAVAWDFPIGDGTAPLRAALDALQPPGTYTIDDVDDADLGDRVVPGTWRAATGTFTVQDLLVDDETFGDLRLDGSAGFVGEAEAELYLHVPASVADAPAGSVPVVLFGHGIFSEPENYLGDEDDPSGVVHLADEMGWILVATKWRGLTYPDLAGALYVAGDFGRLPVITDRLAQGQVNTHTLARLVLDGDLLDDPLFIGKSGQSLPDRSRLLYYGISLGGIEGAVFMSTDAPVERAVLHVGGSTWSTMLERSSNWSVFEGLMVPSVPDPHDRQLLYAVSQLWWDVADPIAYAAELGGRDVLLQESRGDEQVANLTTRALARSADLPLLLPAVEEVPDVPTDAAPTSRAYVQFDPEVALPPDVNRPAEVSGAHDLPRLWEGTHDQIRAFLIDGEIVHFCGDEACAASNPGE